MRRSLSRKAWRDARHAGGQMVAVAIVMVSGISLFVALRSMHGFLLDTMTDYYAEYRFADVFANAVRVPDRVLEEIRRIPGVDRVEARVVQDVVLDVPGLTEPATGRLVSVPESGEPGLNALHMRTGRSVVLGARDEVVISEAFANANGLLPGDSLGAVLNGSWQTLRVVGIALSPEFIYEIRGGGDLFPDNRRFGVLWMGGEGLRSTFRMQGAFNDLAVGVSGGAATEDIIDEIDRILRPYGGIGAYDREDHVSHRFLDDEITETQVTSVLIPGIFLAVTAFLLNMVMARLVASQREQIAVLKAFGYRNSELALHYTHIALIPVSVGTLGGAALGLWMADLLAGIYARFFQFPDATFHPDGSIVLTAVLVSAAAAWIGTMGSVIHAVSLPPAEAMRPPAPGRFRLGPFERLALRGRVSAASRMVLRTMERRPVKTSLSILGIATACGILVTGLYLFDSIDRMKEVQFTDVLREDVMVLFAQPRSARVVYELARLPGVQEVEGFRTVPVRVRSGWRSERSVLTGLVEMPDLHRIVGHSGRPYRPPEGGVMMTDFLANGLGIEPGDEIVVEVLEGERPIRTVTLTAVVDELIGSSVYMSRAGLDALLGESGTLSGAFLAVEPSLQPELYDRLKQLPAVGGVSIRQSVLDGFEDTIAESLYISLTLIVGFACIIAFGIIYNGARIALSERGRELASLRVLGFTKREVSNLLLGEQAILTAVGIPIGIGIGVALGALVSLRLQTMLFRMPLTITLRTCILSAAILVVAAVLSGAVVRRRVRRLDLVSVLKTRE